MPTQPTLWNRFCAKMAGEVSADTLEAYRRASLAVYDALDHLETHRKIALDNGKNVWTMAPAAKAETLCTWNAFVLQTLGDRFLEADYEGDPTTVGFVPPITADQILRFYTPVEGWLNRAQQAHFNPDYKLDWPVPAQLPQWSDVEPCPNAHLVGMLEAMRAVRDHTQAALTFLETSEPKTDDEKKSKNTIRQLQASAIARARYADDMMNGNPSRDVHERVEEHVKAAIEDFFLLGQLLAMPELALKINAPQQQPQSPPKPVSPPTSTFDSFSSNVDIWGTPAPPMAPSTPPAGLGRPNDPNFDMWCLTSPEARTKFKQDREAVRAIKTLWQLDPDPNRTIQIQSEINAALQRGDIGYALDRYNQKLGHFFCAPWGAVYITKRPITLGNERLGAMQQFIFNVTCEGVNLGAPFEREIMTGNFTPTTKFEYGDPNEQPDH
ncbi:hypothetical protein IAD21_01756 [Abditibacteriota bacterium]|nr:hypothetical protein IAD21_01756 [Abditibacteriota bacterium]